ncbi:MAG: ClbS/DfsB family four-helix bundle protein [Candidatus Yanofskybacteria bacterium]|nr:ClbS/DfsB family four-helix bundle protein [Candidatus Yanofskybacteria bacterium]
MDNFEFFESLEPEDWLKKATSRWTVKDVLSHLVGWEREVVLGLKDTFEGGKRPWFMETDDYTEFNERIFNEFKDYSSEALLFELKKWEKTLGIEIERIGEDKIRSLKHMDWVFDEGKGSGDGEGHFEHHINQIKKAISES